MDHLQPRMPYFIIPRFIKVRRFFFRDESAENPEKQASSTESDKRHLGYGRDQLQAKEKMS